MADLAKEANLLTAYFENQLPMNVINNALHQLRPQQRAMGPFTLARSTEEHAGPHNSWFWDPVRQGGGVLSDMGCHSIAVGRYILTPEDKDLLFLEPVSVQCDTSLLKWGQPKYQKVLMATSGVDYSKPPAEVFPTGIITYKNPKTGKPLKSHLTNSWINNKQGIGLSTHALGRVSASWLTSF